MARFQNDAMLNAGLNWVKDNTDKMFICATLASTATYTQAKSAALASVAIASTVFSLSSGVTSGRRSTVAIVSAVSVTTTGSAVQTVLVNSNNSTITYMTPTSAQVVTAGNTITTTAWDIEIGDSVA